MNKQNQIKLNHKCCICNKDIYLGTLTIWEKKFYHTSCLLEEAVKKKDKDFDWFVEKLKKIIWNYPIEFILESETEANAKDVLNDIVQRFDKCVKDLKEKSK